MAKLRNNHSFSVILILCLCLGGIFTVSINQAVGMSVLEIFEADLDQIEFEEDLFILSPFASTLAGWDLSKSESMNLDFRSACLSPASPPPKHF
jgi:hypothetical protein